MDFIKTGLNLIKGVDKVTIKNHTKHDVVIRFRVKPIKEDYKDIRLKPSET